MAGLTTGTDATEPGPVVDALALAHRREWSAVVATTARLTRDLDLAEECTQDAYAQALKTWPRSGIPARPGAWLTTVARNRARDVIGREATLRRTLPELVLPDALLDDDLPADVTGEIPDDRLRLIFTCCHPALAREAQVALTLRLVCGLSTPQIARLFFVPAATMAARITRAKKKISEARIPYRVPAAEERPERLASVLDVVHLVFTTGHAAPDHDRLVRGDLVDRALDLARLLHDLLPDEPGPASLLALVLLIDARRSARSSPDGRLLLLAEQDRSRWDRTMITEGLSLLAGRTRDADRFAIEAALAAVHATAPSWEETDWDAAVGLYDVLWTLWPSPVVELNRAVAVGFRDGPVAGLAALEPLVGHPGLNRQGYLSAARADLLRRLGRDSEAATAYEEAIARTTNRVERAFLEFRLAEVTTSPA